MRTTASSWWLDVEAEARRGCALGCRARGEGATRVVRARLVSQPRRLAKDHDVGVAGASVGQGAADTALRGWAPARRRGINAEEGGSRPGVGGLVVVDGASRGLRTTSSRGRGSTRRGRGGGSRAPGARRGGTEEGGGAMGNGQGQRRLQEALKGRGLGFPGRATISGVRARVGTRGAHQHGRRGGEGRRARASSLVAWRRWRLGKAGARLLGLGSRGPLPAGPNRPRHGPGGELGRAGLGLGRSG